METFKTMEELEAIKLPLTKQDFKKLRFCQIPQVEWPAELLKAFHQAQTEERDELGMMPWD